MAFGRLLTAFILILGSGSISATESGPAEVFIDRGILYGVSDDSLMRLDLRTGEGTLKWKTGESLALDQVPQLDRNDEFWNKVGLVYLSDPGMQRSTGCSAEASAVQNAVSLVESACSGGNSDSCGAALVALDAANSAYSECLRQFLQQY